MTRRRLTDKQALAVNIRGRELEQAGWIAEAIELYESALALGTDTPHTYKRLAVLYRRLKRPDDVDRVRAAMKKQFGHWW